MGRYISAFLLTFFFSVASAQEPAQQSLAETDGAGEIAVENTADDQGVATRLREILDEIGGYEDVTVAVNEGVVRFTGQVAEIGERDELTRLAERVNGVVTVRNAVEQTQDLSAQLEPVIDRLSDRADRALGFLPLALIALLAFAVVTMIGLWLTRARPFWERLAPNRFIGDIYRRIARLAFMLIALVLALDILGATALLGTVLGAAGLIGLAVGFAVRDTVENFIASVMLSLRQPFRPNDFVEIEGDMGHVVRLTSRATVLLSIEGNQIRIPNARVFKARIVNFSVQPERRFDFVLGIDAEADLANARKTALKALDALPFTLRDPPCEAWVEEVGDSNVAMRFLAWVDQRQTELLAARGEAIRVTKGALETAGFGLPEPIYRVRMDDAVRKTSGSDLQSRDTPETQRPPHVANTAPDQEAVKADHSLSRRAAQERDAQIQQGDLLSEDRPIE